MHRRSNIVLFLVDQLRRDALGPTEFGFDRHVTPQAWFGSRPVAPA